jgi:GNAT superfamily N-acetyltransferase
MVTFSEQRDIAREKIVSLYEANGWSSAKKPELQLALLNSHSLVSAWDEERLIGIGNAISDGFLVVYYPHLLVHPDYQKQGIGKKILERLKQRYEGFHQQILVAESTAIAFYEKCGFTRAGKTESMWIYEGDDR